MAAGTPKVSGHNSARYPPAKGMLLTPPRLPSPLSVLLLSVPQEGDGALGEAAAPMHLQSCSGQVPTQSSLLPCAAKGWQS